MFRQVRLGDFFRIKHGFAFKGAHFSDHGKYVVLTPGNFMADGGIKFKGKKEKYYSVEPPADYILERGDLIVVMTDLTQEARILGASAVVPQSGRLLHNQRLGKVIEMNSDELDEKYLYHVFNWSFVREQIKGTATGATVKHTAPDRIYAVKIPLPPLPIQRRIAGILSAYDDLIEVNTRRIKALEEMARSTYEDWRQKKSTGEVLLTDVAEITYGFPFKSKQFCDDPEAIGVIRIRDVRSDRCVTRSFETGKSKHLVTAGDVLVGMDGDFHMNIWAGESSWLNQRVLRVRQLHEWRNSLLFESIKGPIEHLNNTIVGTTVAHLAARDMNKMVVPSFSASDIRVLNEALSNYHDLRVELKRQNTNLRTQRDLLLPRLVSGEIDVSDAEQTLEAAE